jgi:hypothetical protein
MAAFAKNRRWRDCLSALLEGFDWRRIGDDPEKVPSTQVEWLLPRSESGAGANAHASVEQLRSAASALCRGSRSSPTTRLVCAARASRIRSARTEASGWICRPKLSWPKGRESIKRPARAASPAGNAQQSRLCDRLVMMRTAGKMNVSSHRPDRALAASQRARQVLVRSTPAFISTVKSSWSAATGSLPASFCEG